MSAQRSVGILGSTWEASKGPATKLTPTKQQKLACWPSDRGTPAVIKRCPAGKVSTEARLVGKARSLHPAEHLSLYSGLPHKESAQVGEHKEKGRGFQFDR